MREAEPRALLLVMQDRQRQVVARCCAQASAVGVRPGMPLVQARALFVSAGVRVEPWDAAGDRAALRHLAAWAHRLSPVAGVDDSHGEPDGLMLDVTGCERVWGGEERLARAALEGLARLGFTARVAIAPTFGAAWAVARFGGGGALRLVGPADLRAALEPMPIAALRLDPGTIAPLAEIGIERIGHLLDLPRAALPARFGPDLLLRLDQALGRAIETIEPVRPVPPPAAECVFDGPTDRTEAIEQVTRALLDDLALELERRGCGARRLDVTLARSDLEPERFSITLGRPSRDAQHLWRLLRPRLERAHLGFGVEGVTLCAAVVGRLRHEQGECAGAAGAIPAAEIDRACGELLDTLCNRLGRGRVLGASLRASHLPERAFAMVEASGGTPAPAGVAPSDRPTLLLDPPAPAEVIALTPDGPVHRIAWRGREHAVVACVGPERLGAEWWRGHPAHADRTRDYFRVCDERGRWLWLGRVVESGRWFVHGVWA